MPLAPLLRSLLESASEPELEQYPHDGEANATLRMPGGQIDFDYERTQHGGRDVGSAYVTSILVHPKSRRQGIATKLLEALFKLVGNGGYVTLGTVVAQEPIGEKLVRIHHELAKKYNVHTGDYRLDPEDPE